MRHKAHRTRCETNPEVPRHQQALSPAYSKLALPSCLMLTLALLAGCGGDGSSTTASPSSTGPTSPAPTPQPTYSIGGSVSGLADGTPITLLDNGSDALMVKASGPFTFATPIAFNASYAVTLGTQPLWHFCAVGNGSGTATANVTNVAIACPQALAQVTTVAGTTTPGSANGVGSAASFDFPFGAAVDASGYLYVADRSNNMIRKISPAGVVTTLAGSGATGSADGTGSAASFNTPVGMAVDGNGNVYVAETVGNVVRKISPAGVVTTLAGSGASGYADGTGSAASFHTPAGLAVDAAGNLYLADSGNHMIRRISPAGVVTTLAGSAASGHADGTGSAASFKNPAAVAVDAGGNLYVADMGNHMIRKVSPAGAVTTLAGSTASGFADGTGSAASFNGPYGIAVDAIGHVYVADTFNSAIRRISPAGVVTTLAGSPTSGQADGTGSAASFRNPTAVAVDAGGSVYVSDANNNMVRKITPVRAPQ